MKLLTCVVAVIVLVLVLAVLFVFYLAMELQDKVQKIQEKIENAAGGDDSSK